MSIGTFAAGNQASLIETDSGSALASTTWTGTIILYGYQGGLRPTFESFITETIAGVTTTYHTKGTYNGSTSAINAIQILWSGSGSFDAGTYLLGGIG